MEVWYRGLHGKSDGHGILEKGEVDLSLGGIGNPWG